MSERGWFWVAVALPALIVFWASIIRLVAHVVGRIMER